MIILLYILLSLSILMPIYTYMIYPIILKLFSSKKYNINQAHRPFVSIIIAAYNEEKIIAEKINNLAALNYPADKIEFIIGSDGSSDKTFEIAKSYDLPNLRVFDFNRGGKVNALNAMLRVVKGEIIVFSDANTIYDKNAIQNLVVHFTDDRIGCVSGQLRYKIDDTSGHGARSEGTYWRYENWVKEQESKIGRLSGANGAIYAIRNGILHNIKNGIINDDFYVATYVLQAGYDVIMETEAVAYEDPNDDISSQFKRHIRDGAGHYQAIGVFWRMLLPRKGSFVHISHRVIKWLVPFSLIVAFTTNAVLTVQSHIMIVMFVFQIIGYMFLILFYVFSKKNKYINSKIGKIISMVFYFMLVNLALFLGWIRLIRRQQKATWETQR
ncbi:MAG: glycosyltransferase family 2 protein [Eubacteriales bacterium]